MKMDQELVDQITQIVKTVVAESRPRTCSSCEKYGPVGHCNLTGNGYSPNTPVCDRYSESWQYTDAKKKGEIDY